MHTCIPLHGLKWSWHSCPRYVNAGNKNIPSMYHLGRRSVTTSIVGLKNGHIRKNVTQNGEPQRSGWGMQKKKKGRTATPAASALLSFLLFFFGVDERVLLTWWRWDGGSITQVTEKLWMLFFWNVELQSWLDRKLLLVLCIVGG